MMALAGVELETLVSETDALTTQILVYKWKTNGFFIIKNIRMRIFIKRFNEFAFVVVSFNLQYFVLFPIDLMAKFNRVLRERNVALLSLFFTSPHVFLFYAFQTSV